MSTSPQFAFVTLVTSDHYLPGALVVAAALRDVHPSPPIEANEFDSLEFDRVCLVTPETVDVSTIKHLRKEFDVVVGVEVIAQDNEEGLKLLGRLDLKTVLSKLHVFRLTSYRKIIFLDADVLPLRPISHLFRISASFAAVPDVGWPDIFNSGVLVLEPSDTKFDEVMEVVRSKGSWDGGDQGVLNEWIGQDWERLSFTYNTTPTAVYTYAPAYKRFGSDIYNVHFIGPTKPWLQIPFRNPGVSSSSLSLSPNSVFSSYDYPTLLDCWFAVYDKHYRSSTPSVGSKRDPPSTDVPFPTVEPTAQRYENVWNSDAQPRVGVGARATGAPLGLEELRRVAVEGVGDSAPGGSEGIYRTLPLEGRIDLMRPQTLQTVSEERTPMVKIVVPEGPQTPVRSFTPMTTLPTPEPNELPPTPMFRGKSLPPETPTHAHVGSWPHATPDRLQPIASTPSPLSISPARSTSPVRAASPPRRASPPIVLWNPAVEDPPTSLPPTSQLPKQTYYPNAWDVQASDRHIPEDSVGLFPVPPPPSIPNMLITRGDYQAVIGEFNEEGPQRQPSREEPVDRGQYQLSQVQPPQEPTPTLQPSYPQPDRSKVTAVFPWEEKPRHAPVRFFPRTDSPPPGQPFIQPPRSDLKLKSSSPVHGVSSTTSPPQQGFPRTTTYSNAWDVVPSIQRYAIRLVGPAPVSSRWASGSTRKDDVWVGGHRGYRRWQEFLEVSSPDADDEDEGENASEGEASEQNGLGEQSSSTGKKYTARRVQTMRRKLRHQAVQTWDAGGRQPNWSESRDEIPREPIVAEQISADADQPRARLMASSQLRGAGGLGDDARKQTLQPSTLDLTPPSGLSSTALHSSHAGAQSDTASTGARVAYGTGQVTPPLSSMSLSSPEGAAFVPKPPSSNVPVRRPGGRSFDPARDVDVFKKESEEVLARFLKMSSWDEGGATSANVGSSSAV